MGARGRLTVLIVAAGCGGRARPLAPATPPPLAAVARDTSCTAVVTHEVDLLAAVDDLEPQLRAQLTARRGETIATLAAQCEEAAPPEAIRACMLDAPSLERIAACDGDGDGAAAAAAALPGPVADDLARVTGDLAGDGPLIATIETDLGAIHCELAPDTAPVTVANFVGLARGLLPWIDPTTGAVVTDRPLYDGLVFHRVIPEFMIQGGDPRGDGTGGPGYEFADESRWGFDQPGTLAMANSGPDTNGSQFFITEAATPWLDGHHTVFGHCGDLDTVKAIARVPVDANDAPLRPVAIKKITVSRGN